MVSAPTPPAREPGDVISIYSDAYTDVVVDDFDFGLCGFSPAVAEEMIAGNPTQRYLGEGCQGINFENNRIDASAFTHLHFDFYTDETDVIGKVFNLKLVDWAGNATEAGATGLEVNFNDGSNPAITTGSWVSVDVDITVLGPIVIGNLTTSDLAQIHLTSNLSNAWYDNLYLYKGESLLETCNDGVMNQDETGIDCGGAMCPACEDEVGVSDLELEFEVYPNPASDKISLSNVPSHYSYIIYNSVGRKLMSGSNTSSVDISSLMSGMYFIELIGGNNFNTVSFIKN